MSQLIALDPGKYTSLEEMLQAESFVDSDVYTGGGDLVPPDSLVGITMLITGYDVRESNRFFTTGPDGVVRGAEYITVHCVVAGPRIVLFNDGGVGIRPVLEEHFRENPDKALYCKRGLRMSEYSKTLPDGEIISASTAYIG